MVAVVVSPTTIGRSLAYTALSLAVVATAVLTRAQSAPLLTTAVPGGLTDGTMLLANGWRLAPAGRHLTVGTLPLNLVLSPDGRYAIVTNNGLDKPSLTVIDVANWSVKTSTVVDHAWYGLAWHPDGTKLYSSGAAQNTVREFVFADGVITPSRTFTLPVATGDTFAGGLMGYLASQKTLDEAALRRAMIFGSVMASFNVEEFGTERIQRLTHDEINQRFRDFKRFTHFEEFPFERAIKSQVSSPRSQVS